MNGVHLNVGWMLSLRWAKNLKWHETNVSKHWALAQLAIHGGWNVSMSPNIEPWHNLCSMVFSTFPCFIPEHIRTKIVGVPCWLGRVFGSVGGQNSIGRIMSLAMLGWRHPVVLGNAYPVVAEKPGGCCRFCSVCCWIWPRLYRAKEGREHAPQGIILLTCLALLVRRCKSLWICLYSF